MEILPSVPSEHTAVAVEAARLFNAADWDALREMNAANSTMWPPEGWPEPGPFEGREAVLGEFRRLRDAFAEHDLTVLSMLARGAWVVARYRWVVTGAGSGAPAAVEISAALRFEDARIVESHFHWQHDDALVSAGMTPGV